MVIVIAYQFALVIECMLFHPQIMYFFLCVFSKFDYIQNVEQVNEEELFCNKNGGFYFKSHSLINLDEDRIIED